MGQAFTIAVTIFVAALLAFGASTVITAINGAHDDQRQAALITRLETLTARVEQNRVTADRRLCQAIQATRATIRSTLRAARQVQRQIGASPPPTESFYALAIAKTGRIDCTHPGSGEFHLTITAREHLTATQRKPLSRPATPQTGSRPTVTPKPGTRPRPAPQTPSGPPSQPSAPLTEPVRPPDVTKPPIPEVPHVCVTVPLAAVCT
jgi:hypothetical protein